MAGEVPAQPERLILYDGACGLCLGAVGWLRRHDRDGALRFEPLQGDVAARARARHPELPPGVETVVLLEDGRVELRSRAILGALRHLPAPWRWLAVMRRLPRWMLDPAYRLVARLRPRGEASAACRAPARAEPPPPAADHPRGPPPAR